MPDPLPTPAEVAASHADFVRALALRMAPLPGLAEDIAQQVLLEFLGKGAEWDLARDPKPLLARMTRNVARRAWRDRTHDMPDVVRELADHIRGLGEDHEVTWFGDEEKQALRRCLERLPEKSRHLVTLHYDLEVTSVEIGHQLAMNADAVRRALFRLRGQLRKCIQRALREPLT